MAQGNSKAYLVGELRQLAHDLIAVSPQSSAIKAKHPRILDDAARWIVELEEELLKSRKILAHVPAKVALKAKEDAGFGECVVTKGEVPQKDA